MVTCTVTRKSLAFLVRTSLDFFREDLFSFSRFGLTDFCVTGKIRVDQLSTVTTRAEYLR